MALLAQGSNTGALFSFEIDGVEVFNRAFNRLEQEIDDLRSIWPAVAEEIQQIEVAQFESEGAVGSSGRWAALSPAYAKYKVLKFPGKTILRRTDSLFDSLTNVDAPGAVFRPERTQLTIGSSVDYGVYHQRGSGLPRRSVYSFNETQKRRIQKAIQAGLVAFVRRQGFVVLEKAA